MIGPELNFLFRMEKIGVGAGSPFCILSAQAEERLRGHYPTSPLGRFALKGFEGKYYFFAGE